MTTTMPEVPAGVELVKFAASHVLPLRYTPEGLQEAEQVRNRLVRFKRNLLPLEQAAPVNARLDEALHTYGELQAQQSVVRAFGSRYQILDPSVFTWRDATGMPRLMPFAISVPHSGFVFRVRDRNVINEADIFGGGITSRSESCSMYPTFPIHLTEHYADVLKVVAEKGRHHYHNQLSRSFPWQRVEVEFKMLTSFGGYIPEEVKMNMLRAWHSGIFHRMVIVSEVAQWDENFVVTSRQGDPLVVGYDGYQLWLLDAFDTTDLEQVVRDEFCTRVGN